MEYKWTELGISFEIDNDWLNKPLSKPTTLKEEICRWLGNRGWFGIRLPLTNKQQMEMLIKYEGVIPTPVNLVNNAGSQPNPPS